MVTIPGNWLICLLVSMKWKLAQIEIPNMYVFWKVQSTNPVATTVSFWCLIIKQALVSWKRQRDLQTLKALFLPLLAHFSDLMRAVVLEIDLLTAGMGQNPSLQLTHGSYMSGDLGLADSFWQWGWAGMLQLAVESIPNSSHYCFSVSCKGL